MKNILFFFFGMFLSQMVVGQEIAPQGKLSIEVVEEKREISVNLPELSFSSFYKSELSAPQFSLTEVDFSDKKKRRSVDLVAMMEAERAYRERIAQNSFQASFALPEDRSVFSIGKGVQLYSRASNYDWYTGETKNPAYRELQAGFLKPRFYDTVDRNYFNPYSYSPYNYFLR